MKLFLFSLSLLFFAFTAYSQKKTVSQKIMCTHPYCGGARPTPEMEENAQKPKPYSDKTIIIISKTGKVDSVKTDEEGSFKKDLKYGKYKFYEAWKYYKKTPNDSKISAYDKNCLKTEWKKEFKVITVTKEKIMEVEKYQLIMHCPWSTPCVLDKTSPP